MYTAFVQFILLWKSIFDFNRFKFFIFKLFILNQTCRPEVIWMQWPLHTYHINHKNGNFHSWLILTLTNESQIQSIGIPKDRIRLSIEFIGRYALTSFIYLLPKKKLSKYQSKNWLLFFLKRKYLVMKILWRIIVSWSNSIYVEVEYNNLHDFHEEQNRKKNKF